MRSPGPAESSRRSTSASPPPEQAAILADCGARCLIADDDHLERAGLLAQGMPGLRCIHAGNGPAPTGWLSYERLIMDASPAPDACRAGDDVACLFYTSGSTGRPKGVMHTHTNLVASAIAFAAAIGLNEDSVALVAAPDVSCGRGGSVHAGDGQRRARAVVVPRFEPAQVMRLIEQQRATMTSVVPTMLRMLMDHPNARRHDLSSMRTVLYGAAPMPEALVIPGARHFPAREFTHCYGMTESTASVSVAAAAFRDALASPSGQMALGRPR
jgi:long-chain acyl-CoA synthetase